MIENVGLFISGQGQKVVALIVMAVVAIAAPTVAWSLDLSPQELERLEELIATAIEKQNEGDHRAALRNYRRAAAISDHPRIQLEKAVSHRELGDCERAEQIYLRVLESADDDSSLAEDARDGMAELEPCLDRGDVVIQCYPADRDVRLFIDGGSARSKKEGVCPVRWTIAPGEYALEAEAEGYESAQKPFRVIADERVSVNMELRPERGEGSDTHWTQYGSYGALGLGTLLFGAAVISDRNTDERRQNLSNAYESGDPDLIEQWESHNKRVRRRNIAMYGLGTTMLLAGGAGLVWNMVLREDSPPPSSASRWRIEPTPRGVGLSRRW